MLMPNFNSVQIKMPCQNPKRYSETASQSEAKCKQNKVGMYKIKPYRTILLFPRLLLAHPVDIVQFHPSGSSNPSKYDSGSSDPIHKGPSSS